MCEVYGLDTSFDYKKRLKIDLPRAWQCCVDRMINVCVERQLAVCRYNCYDNDRSDYEAGKQMVDLYWVGRDDNEEDNEADPEGGHVGMIMQSN